MEHDKKKNQNICIKSSFIYFYIKKKRETE